MRKLFMACVAVMLAVCSVACAEGSPSTIPWYFYGYDTLWKIGPETADLVKMSDDRSVRIIGERDGWLYYLCENGFSLRNAADSLNLPYFFNNYVDLVKIKTDGNGRTVLYHCYADPLGSLKAAMSKEDIFLLREYAGLFRLSLLDDTLIPVLELPLNDEGYASYGIEAFAVHDDWLYYVSEQDYAARTAKLNKVKTDGTENTLIKVLGHFPLWCFLDVSDDAILITEGNGLSRISPDGKTGEVIHTFERENGGAAFVEKVGEDLYYTEEFAKLRKLNLRTHQITFITDTANPNDIIIDGEWIYYSRYVQSEYNLGVSPLYRVKVDGTENMLLADGKCHQLSMNGGMLHYTRTEGSGWSDDQWCLYRIRDNETEIQKIIVDNLYQPRSRSDGWLKAETVGGISLGMTEEQVSEVLGDPDNMNAETFVVEEDDCGCGMDTRGLLRLYTDKASELFYMDNTDNQVFVLSVAFFGAESGALTSRGVGISSTSAEVLAAYRDKYSDSQTKGFENRLIVAGSHDDGIVFFLDGLTGLVHSIAMGSIFAYDYAN